MYPAVSDFRVEGVGCWCPGERTLHEMRLMGHTPDCRKAREGWDANYRHLAALDRQRAIEREVGRQVLAESNWCYRP